MSKRVGDPGYPSGWCVHYRAPTNEGTCEAGVRYDSMSHPRACFLTNGESRPGAAVCDKLRRPTPDEIAAHNEWARKRTENLFKAIAGTGDWRGLHKGQSASEVVTCPVCKGRLQVSIARNGHMSGYCATPNCVSWIE